MKIVLIGAGNLATNLGKSLLDAGNNILQIYSRTTESAIALANKLDCSYTTNLAEINSDADIYIVSVKDSVITNIIPQLCNRRTEKIFLHTAGSVDMNVFNGMALHFGVLYPMQTFSKNKILKFKDIPCFIEANDNTTFNIIKKLAEDISTKVYPLASDKRKYLHLAAVFACNFVNHCYEISAELLTKHGIPFDIMLPLIDETAKKVHFIAPSDAQTGPAVRYDRNVIRAQSDLLKDNPIFKQIYEYMSISIHHVEQNK